MEEKSFKILSIDGGGIRGIYPARFLTELEEEINQKCPEKKNICDYFDLICGTSTGGIIALGLALGMPAQDILLLYRENAKKIFPGKPGIFSYLRKPKYSNDYLYNLLKKTFQPLSKTGDTRLGHSRTRVCIPTFNAYLGKAHIYKTAHHPDLKRDYQIPAHDVALSTASAPIYFKPHSFKYKHVRGENEICVNHNVDGGIIANNPTLIGIIEAHCALDVPLEEIKVLSLGTGHLKFSETLNPHQFGIMYWLKRQRVFEMMFSAQAQNTDNTIKFLASGLGHTSNSRFFYKRVQYDFQKGESIDMDESTENKITQLEDIGVQSFKEHGAEIVKEFFNSQKREYKPLKQI